jgi:hypothetical protein
MIGPFSGSCADALGNGYYWYRVTKLGMVALVQATKVGR